MDQTRAKLLLALRKSRSQAPADLFDPTFPHQREFILDPYKLKALFCTRRAAKSYTAGLYLVYEALTNPGCNCLFIGLTRSSAKGIVWKDILRVIDRKFRLKAKFNLAELTMTLPNGSVISITGVDVEENEMNKLLGRKYRLVCIDEASLYSVDMAKLVYGILKPAMTDPNLGGQRGTICLFGTSSNFTRGLFYDITTKQEPGWSLHSWTAHDNPYVAKQWQEELDEIDKLRPLYKSTPQYQQWYLNKWVVDEEKLVYRFSAEKNVFRVLPKGLTEAGWTYTLGIDLGYEDDTAFVLSGFHANDPNLYVLSTYKAKHLSLDQVVKKIQLYQADTDRCPSRVIIDGSAKQAVETMRVRSSIPFEYADKQGKVEFIEILNADLIQSKLKIHAGCHDLIDEMMGLVWKTTGDKISLPRKEHPSLPNHLCDAFLYSWRMAYHYHASPLQKVIVQGSKEWYEQTTVEIWEKERERLINDSNQGGWPEGSDGSGGWGQL